MLLWFTLLMHGEGSFSGICIKSGLKTIYNPAPIVSD